MTYDPRGTAHSNCAYWRQLDEQFNTPPNSPLHHDWRCSVHGHEAQFITYRVTEWDHTQLKYGPGAFIFELNGGERGYVIRTRQPQFIHLNRFFETVTVSGIIEMKRIGAVTAYRILHAQHFGIARVLND